METHLRTISSTPVAASDSAASRSSSLSCSSGMPALPESMAPRRRSFASSRRSRSSLRVNVRQARAIAIRAAADAKPLTGRSTELLFDPGADSAHVGLALRLRFHDAHDFAHVLDRGGAGGGDGFSDERVDLR